MAVLGPVQVVEPVKLAFAVEVLEVDLPWTLVDLGQGVLLEVAAQVGVLVAAVVGEHFVVVVPFFLVQEDPPKGEVVPEINNNEFLVLCRKM